MDFEMVVSRFKLSPEALPFVFAVVCQLVLSETKGQHLDLEGILLA